MRKASARFGAAMFAAIIGCAMLQTPASAATYNVSTYISAEPCAPAICLHYRLWAEGGRYIARENHYEFTHHSFASYAGMSNRDGVGEAIRNNAASINNKSSRRATVYYSPGYGGNSDYINAGYAGNLHYTSNNNASIRV
jgi:hypothetical protein